MKTIPSLVLTGGPCAGKTTGIAYLQQNLEDRGKHVVIVPEVPTLLIQNGIAPLISGGKLSDKRFQYNLVATMCALEGRWRQMAAEIESGDVVMIFDRGIPDTRAYMPGGMYEEMLPQVGLSPLEALDAYDCVIHLRSAACGAEDFYTLANNTARYETLEDARLRDRLTDEAWNGHSHKRVIENVSGGFEARLKELLRHSCRMLGIPEPLEVERKFLVASVDWEVFPMHQSIEIEQMYLVSDREGNELRIRKRRLGGAETHYKTTKRSLRPGVRIETETRISRAEYEALRSFQVSGTKVIRKTRTSFVYQGHYFELDAFSDPNSGMLLLEVELADEGDPVSIPPFVVVEREVTTDSGFSNFAIANAA